MTPVWVNSEIIITEKIFSPTDRRSVGRSVGRSFPAADAANAARLSRRR